MVGRSRTAVALLEGETSVGMPPPVVKCHTVDHSEVSTALISRTRQ